MEMKKIFTHRLLCLTCSVYVLLMTSYLMTQSNTWHHIVGMWSCKMISISLDIVLTHSHIHGRSCKKVQCYFNIISLPPDPHNIHSSYPIWDWVISVSHSMGLAAPGNIAQWLSMHRCPVGQCQKGHIHWHYFSHIRTTSFKAFLPIWCWESLKFVTDLMQDVTCCISQDHLSCLLGRATLISSMPNLWGVFNLWFIYILLQSWQCCKQYHV